VLHFSQERQLTFALGEGDKGLLAAFADNSGFPITEAAALLHKGRSLADAASIGELAPPVITAVTLAPLFLAAQVPDSTPDAGESLPSPTSALPCAVCEHALDGGFEPSHGPVWEDNRVARYCAAIHE
jgi:hypothetical protein